MSLIIDTYCSNFSFGVKKKDSLLKDFIIKFDFILASSGFCVSNTFFLKCHAGILKVIIFCIFSLF